MLVLVLIIVIVSLIILLLLLYNNYQQEQNQFLEREMTLRKTITDIKEKQNVLNNQIKLSEEFNTSYQKSKNNLTQSIYDINIELLNNHFQKKED